MSPLHARIFWDGFSWIAEFKTENEFMGSESFSIEFVEARKYAKPNLWILFSNGIRFEHGIIVQNSVTPIPNKMVLSLLGYKDKLSQQIECWTWYVSATFLYQAWH